VTITRGPGPRGLAPPAGVEPSMLVTVAALSPPLATPRRLVVFDGIRKSASPLGRFKFLGGYGPNIAGLAFANKQGADDALLLNDEGAVICATSANIYLCSAGGEVKSPRVESGAMPGVVREVLLSESLGIEMANVEVDELRDHCVFVSNSLIGIEQASVAGHECNMTEAQSVAFQRLRQSYARALAKNLSDVGRDR
jgi:branched-chain amino acid aminotransferase